MIKNPNCFQYDESFLYDESLSFTIDKALYEVGKDGGKYVVDTPNGDRLLMNEEEYQTLKSTIS